MRKVFLDDLPKRGSFIDWKNSVGIKEIKFIYDDIKGELEIIDYKNKYLYIKYQNKEFFEITTDGFKNGHIGKLVGKITNEFKIDIGMEFINDKQNFIIIGKEYRKDNNNYNWKWYKYRCNNCNWDNGWVEESALLNGQGCSCCSGRTVVQRINDIATTNPELIKFFQNPEDAKLYTKSSNQTICPICPDCGRIKNKPTKISRIFETHSIGCLCSDSISIPEKVMYSILEQLNIEFLAQLNKRIYNWCKNYRYDFYIYNLNIIIETHGIQHYEEKERGRSLQEEQENDRCKKELALKNDIKNENYIVIDCSKSEIDFIKNSILNSRLAEIFDLSNINWIKCYEYALSNLVKKVCEIKKGNPSMSTDDISKIIRLSRVTVTKYLKKGVKLGWCDYNPKEEMKNSAIKNNKSNCKPVEIFNNGISVGVFSSIKSLVEQSEQLFKIKLSAYHILSVCNGEKLQYKGFIFKFIILKKK